MMRAIERHNVGETRVIPIILRPTDWKGTPFEQLQVLPSNAKPVTQWQNCDNALLDVARGIRATVEELLASSSGSSPRDTKQIRAKKETLRLWKVPSRRNPFFTGREDILTILHNQLHREGVASLTQPQAISGLGGIRQDANRNRVCLSLSR